VNAGQASRWEVPRLFSTGPSAAAAARVVPRSRSASTPRHDTVRIARGRKGLPAGQFAVAALRRLYNDATLGASETETI
jgi:hypothetical protein